MFKNQGAVVAICLYEMVTLLLFSAYKLANNKIIRRGFSDNNLYVAYNSRPKITPISVSIKRKRSKSNQISIIAIELAMARRKNPLD